MDVDIKAGRTVIEAKKAELKALISQQSKKEIIRERFVATSKNERMPPILDPLQTLDRKGIPDVSSNTTNTRTSQILNTDTPKARYIRRRGVLRILRFEPTRRLGRDQEKPVLGCSLACQHQPMVPGRRSQL